jgi:6-phosphofructokinase 1
MGVYKLFTEGVTGCMVYLDLNGNIKSLYLKDMQDPATGKIPQRGVNIHTDKVQQILDHILNYITPDEYEAAKKYVPNPEEFDFKKILNW